MSEFDYQWANLGSAHILYNKKRIEEFLKITGIKADYFDGKKCLDAGCGNGRYTYAMQELGADVDSIDISEEAVKKCREINPKAMVMSIFDLFGVQYDFIFSFGVIHHTPYPRRAFSVLVESLAPGGIISLMVYMNKYQTRYKELRGQFKAMSLVDKLKLCQRLVDENGGDLHGWFDALNPEHNFSYEEDEVVGWFKEEGLVRIKRIKYGQITIRGKKI